MRIAFIDFDGTLFDERESLEQASLKVLGKKLSKEEIRKLPKDIKSKIYEINITEFYNLYRPIKEGIDRVLELKGRGYKIIILTARLCRNKEFVEKILKNNDIPYDELICREDLSLKDEEWKAKTIKEFLEKFKVEDIVILEDKEENIAYIEKYLGRKVKGILISNQS